VVVKEILHFEKTQHRNRQEPICNFFTLHGSL
jgi:hypothetical protein